MPVVGGASTSGVGPTSDGAHVRRLGALLASGDLELHALVLFQRTVAVRLDGREVDEDVGRAAVRRDEAEALLAVEPLHVALCHAEFSLRVMLFGSGPVTGSGPRPLIRRSRTGAITLGVERPDALVRCRNSERPMEYLLLGRLRTYGDCEYNHGNRTTTRPRGLVMIPTRAVTAGHPAWWSARNWAGLCPR